MAKPTNLTRSLLAICTFVLPLGMLAWGGHQEIQRQARSARSALDREALEFLRGAAREVDSQFDALLPAVMQEAEQLLKQYSPAHTTRLLRARGFAHVLDIVRFDNRARLLYPVPSTNRPSLPFLTDSASNRNEDDSMQSSRTALHLADLLISKGHLEDAARQLELALEEHKQKTEGRYRLSLQTALTFRLATVQKKLGDMENAVKSFTEVRDLVAEISRLRGSYRWYGSWDYEPYSLDISAELALAEAEVDPQARLELVRNIANGGRDFVSEQLLSVIANRALAGIPAGSPARAAAEELRLDVGVHLRTREFANDYDRLLRERVRSKLTGPTEPPISGEEELRQVITGGNVPNLLLLRREPGANQNNGSWLGIRLDLGQVLAGVLESYVQTNISDNRWGIEADAPGTFVLAVADGDNNPIVSPPAAPDEFTATAVVAYGMTLRAYPADVQTYMDEAQASADASTLLLFGLLVVASIGAVWLWRSVTRESELLALKVDLVSRVSHELKTPLALISLYGETLGLKRARNEEQAAQFGDIIAREAGRLTTMIQRILDFSRQEAGTLQYEPSPTDLGEALAEVANNYTAHLDNKGARLETDLPPDVIADVDRAALGGVVINLLENAIKYAREDEPDLQLRIELRTQGQKAQIDVLDRGRGVPDDQREMVFDSFYRASNSGEVRGAGLGLSLVRHFAEAHDGSVHILPRPGGGSIVRLSLPLYRQSLSNDAKHSQTHERPVDSAH
ncbi:MAG: HAMP domain-containing sensor histidine kinase [Planctomycetota bacterium]|nr:HAMP domain-containing sensor histidine kinase [Planctomycetota bacterium]